MTTSPLKKILGKAQIGTLRKCFVLLNKNEIRKLYVVGLAQLFLAFFDLIGVLSIGLIGALSVYGIQSRSPSSQVTWALELLNIEDLTLQFQVAILGCLAGVLLITKTFCSAYINKKTLFFLAVKSAELSSRLIERLTFSNLEQIKKRSRFENMFLLTAGVQNITVGVIGVIIGLFADITLIIIMFFGLLAVDLSIAISIVTFFGAIGYLLYKLINVRLVQLVTMETEYQILNNQLLYELFGIYREIFARGIRDSYVSKIASERTKSALISAEVSFLPSVSKYVLEVAFVVGAFVFIGLQFILKDAAGAISTIGIFIASAGRVIPAILRIQGSAITFRSSLVGAKRTFDVIGELEVLSAAESANVISYTDIDFTGKIVFQDVSFTYMGNLSPTLKNLKFEIAHGDWVALVGPSGAGKTTLVDVMLGILKPTSGYVLLSGNYPESSVSRNPGCVSYVPQESFIFEGSLAHNVAIGIEFEEIDFEKVKMCLELVGLGDLVNSSELGVNLAVGELGSKISGGQKQRLGIARALYSSPKILILDEATSALDAVSEERIIKCLRSLKGNITIVSIAHRLSTVTSADKILYLDEGSIRAQGNFRQVRDSVPNFDKQAELLGIARD